MEKSKLNKQNFDKNRISINSLIKSPKNEIVLSEPNLNSNTLKRNKNNLITSNSNKRFNFMNKRIASIIEPDSTSTLNKLSMPIKINPLQSKLRNIVSPLARTKLNNIPVSEVLKGGK